MTAREILAYAITHAGFDAKGKAIKGGPYEAHGRAGAQVPTLHEAMRWEVDKPLPETLRAIRKVHPHARVIRIVRARPTPSEASAAEVLRDLVAYTDFLGGTLTRIQARARRVLAAAGPDPMPVARAAMAWRYGRRGDTGPMNALAEAVETYRKAGGK